MLQHVICCDLHQHNSTFCHPGFPENRGKLDARIRYCFDQQGRCHCPHSDIALGTPLEHQSTSQARQTRIHNGHLCVADSTSASARSSAPGLRLPRLLLKAGDRAQLQVADPAFSSERILDGLGAPQPQQPSATAARPKWNPGLHTAHSMHRLQDSVYSDPPLGVHEGAQVDVTGDLRGRERTLDLLSKCLPGVPLGRPTGLPRHLRMPLFTSCGRAKTPKSLRAFEKSPL